MVTVFLVGDVAVAVVELAGTPVCAVVPLVEVLASPKIISSSDVINAF